MATITYLTTIQFDYGIVQTAGAECRRLGIARPLVVTDAGIRAIRLAGPPAVLPWR
jgi:4-hydroxybutyrate dehydrogenase